MTRQHNLSIDTEAAAKGQKINKQKNRYDTDSDDSNYSIEGNNDNNIIDIDEDDELSSSPSIPDEDIDFDLVYALHTFQATVEGQATVDKGEPLSLLDDSNSYWWLVKVLRSDEVGYIPAENIETPFERLARLNKHRNVNLSSSVNNTEDDIAQKLSNDSQGKAVLFSSPLFVVAKGEMYEVEEEDEDYDYFEDEYLDDGEEELDEEINEIAIEQDEREPIVDETEEIENLYGQDNNSTKISDLIDNIITQEDQVQNDENMESDGVQNNMLMGQQTLQSSMDQQQPKNVENVENVENAVNAVNGNRQLHQQKQTSPIEASQADSKSSVQPFNISDMENSETIKLNLTPVLGSDFIDFSDEEEEGRKSKQSVSLFGRNDSSDSKPPVTFEEYNKPVEVNVKKSKKEKKENKGFMKNLFSRKKKRKDEGPVKPIEQTNISNTSQQSQRQIDQNQFQSMNSMSNQQQRVNQPQMIQGQMQPPPQNIKQEQMYGRPPNQPIQVQQQQQQQQQQFQQQQQQQQQQQVQPAQVQQNKQNKKVPSPIQVQQYSQSENSTSVTPATPVTPTYNVLRIFTGQNIQSDVDFKIVLLKQNTTVTSLIKQTLTRFKLDSKDNWDDYFITIKEVDGDIIHLMPHDHPLEIFKTLTSSYTVPLPTVRRSSITSVSSNISTHTAISTLGLQDDKNIVTFYLNKKDKSRKTNRISGEKKLRIRILIYTDDLPSNLRAKGMIPRTSLSVPKHLAEKAARRRSREEGKPKEKTIIVAGIATVNDVIEKSMEKFGILDGIVDDGKQILENDDEKPRYRLMIIVDGEEKLLDPGINIISVYPSPPNLHHLSIESFDSNSSSAWDYRPDEPIFVLRLLRPEDRQQRSMPSASEINRFTKNMGNSQNLNSNKASLGSGNNNEALSKKQLIEQQRKYSQAKQKSIISASQNAGGVDIVTRIGSIRSSRIFGSKVRYSFVPAGGEEIDISDIIEDIWGDDEILNEAIDESESTKEPTSTEFNEPKNGLSPTSPLSIDKKQLYRRSSTQDVDILEKIVNNTDPEELPSMEEKIDRVLNKVKKGYYGVGPIKFRQSQAKQNNDEIKLNDDQPPVKGNDDSLAESAELVGELPSITDGRKSRKRSPSSASANSSNSINTMESSTSTRKQSSSSVLSSLTESDWILTDDFGLQELLILVRSGVNMLELKERRRSGWHLNDDPEKILEQIKPSEIRDEIKTVFADVNNELDKLEQELDQIMDDAVRAF